MSHPTSQQPDRRGSRSTRLLGTDQEPWGVNFISGNDQAATGLRDVCVNHEGLIFRRGRIFTESFTAPMYAVHYKTVRGYLGFLVKDYVLRRSDDEDVGLWVIDNFSPGNYHHWVIDCLARLVSAEEQVPEVDVLLLPDYYAHQSYVPFTLQAFPQIRVKWISARADIRVGRLAVIPHPAIESRRPLVYSGVSLREVARRVGGLVEQPGSARGIYFTREDASRRRATNERDLVQVLRSFDIEVMQVDPARPWEQVRASLGARLMVSVHGAALTNMIFMPPGARVLELRRPEVGDIFFFDHYRPLAAVMGLDYQAQYCEMAGDAVGYEMNNADLVVDLDLLRENLRR